MVMSRPEGLENWTETVASAAGEAKLPLTLTMAVADVYQAMLYHRSKVIWEKVKKKVGTKVQSRDSRAPGRRTMERIRTMQNDGERTEEGEGGKRKDNWGRDRKGAIGAGGK